MVSWLIGRRGAQDALAFMQDVASRLTNRVQLTTDGHHAYLYAVEDAFQRDVDYAQLVKIYGEDSQAQAEHHYSPAKCLGTKREPALAVLTLITSQPALLRSTTRRCAKTCADILADGGAFKEIENHRFATALHFVHYNFARICQSIRCTPAMEAGISNHVWSIEELVRLSN